MKTKKQLLLLGTCIALGAGGAAIAVNSTHDSIMASEYTYDMVTSNGMVEETATNSSMDTGTMEQTTPDVTGDTTDYCVNGHENCNGSCQQNGTHLNCDGTGQHLHDGNGTGQGNHNGMGHGQRHNRQ